MMAKMDMGKEIKTARLMIDLYCRDQHGSRDRLCPQCLEIFDYLQNRLEKCPFKESKPKCSQCTVHCYRPDMREKIKAVMQYAGPRIIYRHPVLTARHYLAGK